MFRGQGKSMTCPYKLRMYNMIFPALSPRRGHDSVAIGVRYPSTQKRPCGPSRHKFQLNSKRDKKQGDVTIFNVGIIRLNPNNPLA